MMGLSEGLGHYGDDHIEEDNLDKEHEKLVEGEDEPVALKVGGDRVRVGVHAHVDDDVEGPERTVPVGTLLLTELTLAEHEQCRADANGELVACAGW